MCYIICACIISDSNQFKSIITYYYNYLTTLLHIGDTKMQYKVSYDTIYYIFIIIYTIIFTDHMEFYSLVEVDMVDITTALVSLEKLSKVQKKNYRENNIKLMELFEM